MANTEAFNICVIKPPGYIHAHAFDELVELISLSLRDLCFSVTCNANQVVRGARNLVVGIHLLSETDLNGLPAGTIGLNTEQLASAPDRWRQAVMVFAARFPVWDYSDMNLSFLRQQGFDSVRKLGIGYHQGLRRLPRAENQDIDVLFYGSLGPRRQSVLDQLCLHGLYVESVFGVYGSERDALISRAKVVINIHHYSAKIFEIVRVFYLMTNAKAVVSECGRDTAMDAIYRPGISAVAYEDLVGACEALVRDDQIRHALEQKAFTTIQSLPQAEFTRQALFG